MYDPFVLIQWITSKWKGINSYFSTKVLRIKIALKIVAFPLLNSPSAYTVSK